MKRKHRRLSFVMLALVALGAAAAMVMAAFEENIVFFFSPTEIAEKVAANEITPDRRLRLGGLVADDSLVRGGVESGSDGVTIKFTITDTVNTVPVEFKGILPDLFREGQGVVAEGNLIAGVFKADSVLAKHDENYMPPEVTEALKKAEHWKEKMANQDQSGQDQSGEKK